MNDAHLTRRAFLSSVAGASMAALLACAGSLRTIRGESTPEGVEILRTTLVALEEGERVWLVRSETLREPVLLMEIEPDRYRALGTTCTHLGCQVRHHGGFLTCPCHGSTFDLSGHVTRGPAELSLHSYSLQVTQDRIRILSPEPAGSADTEHS